MTAGRPKEFTQEWIDDHIDSNPAMYENGESNLEVAVELGMCKDTFYELKKEYPEFSDAVKKGLVRSEAWWSKLGRFGAAGKADIQPTTWIFNMKNRFNWRDKTEATVEVAHTLQKMSEEALDQYIEDLTNGES